MEDNKNIVVSVIVVTYNSAEFILETLESIKKQNCERLELIISDDGSKDNTVELCRTWIKNNDVFSSTKVLTVEQNTGVPANLNRGIAAASGEWIKGIAGDDILLCNCISDNLESAQNFPDDKIFISNMKSFRDDVTIYEKTWVPAGVEVCGKDGRADIQYQFLLKNYFGNSPALFFNRKIFDIVTYDEDIRFMEDYPFALNITKAGFRYVYFNKETVGYRVGNSLSNSTNRIFNDFYKKEIAFKENYIFPFASPKIVKYHKFEHRRKVFFEKYKLNKKNIINQVLYRIATCANPYRY